jgi:hypothetical protein
MEKGNVIQMHKGILFSHKKIEFCHFGATWMEPVE